MAVAQRPSDEKKHPKGPRALGLIELQPKGQARLIPITILVDGTYYDAVSYKAAPVPIALESGTVYEGYEDGASQGLMTVSTALSGPNNTWLGEGTWQTTEELAARKVKKKESVVPRGLEDTDAPPKLLRRAETKNTDTNSAASPAPAAQSADIKPAPASPAPTPSTPPTAPAPQASTTTTTNNEPQPDPNVPTLKRGKPAGETDDMASVPFGKSAPASMTKTPSPSTSSPAPAAARPKPASAPAKKADIQLLPAISDANGPEPHSYNFPMKEGEEEAFRKKMLNLAAEDIIKRDRELAAATVSQPAAPSVGKHSPKPVQPNFSDVNLHVFDLTSGNEPTIILSATATVSVSAAPARQYLVTVVAREDIYGDLHRAFSSVTDDQHLDVIPRMELIDAVDVDGDGRGELLFRRIYDSGSAYVIYRVIGAQLYALFEGTPS